MVNVNAIQVVPSFFLANRMADAAQGIVEIARG
jgi:hypothetical protein